MIRQVSVQWEETDEIALAGVGLSEREREKEEAAMSLSPRAVVIYDRTSEMLVVTVVHFSTVQTHLLINITINCINWNSFILSVKRTTITCYIATIRNRYEIIIWYLEISDKVPNVSFSL